MDTNEENVTVQKRGRGSGDKTHVGRKARSVEAHVRDAHVIFQRAKAKREAHNANIAELEERRLRGELMDVQEARKMATNAAKTVRETLLALPARLSAIVADKPEPEVLRHLDAEVRALLASLAPELTNISES